MMPSLPLANGLALPQLGFGVYQISPDDTIAAVTTALDAGYRHIDTAARYRNEQAVGEAICASGIPRDEVWVTTKVWNADQGYDATLRACETSLRELGMEYVDLYLIHWAVPGLYAETWRAMERLYAEGRVRAIGVSNFQPHHLGTLAETATVTPMVNQVELHPMLPQRAVRAYGASRGIVTTAWSPLMRGGELLTHPTIIAIAATHEKSPAQVVLRWSVQLGNVVIPRSVNPARIRENAAIFGWELTRDEMAQIDALDTGVRIGPDPDNVNF